MATYKHLRSSTANKRPTTSIADGQLAINTNTASPGLFFKDSAGTGIVKVGPVHVGTTAPNATPGAGGSTGNYTGEQWLDTSVSPAQIKVWSGSAWVGIVADELPVSKLQDGAARQLLQTDAAGTGVEWTSNVDVPGTLDVTGATTLDSTLTVPLGSAAAPTVRFTGDTNTGIYSPSADQVAVATNGTQRLTVDTAATTSTLPIVHPLGAVGTPSITFTGDLNTGFWSPTADTLAASTNGSERLRITSAGLVGIGTSSPSYTLDVTGSARITSASPLWLGTTTGDSYIQYGANATTSNNWTVGSQADGSFRFFNGTYSSGTERLRIDSSGKLLIGSSTDRFSTKLLVEGTDGTGGATFARSSNDAGSPYSFFLKSRGTTVGSNTVVQSGDTLGFIGFYGTDGTSPIPGASIQAQVDGTPGTNDMPGRLVFSTTADGASSTTERMRIDNLGRIFTYNANTGNNSFIVASAAAAGTAVANFIGAYGATGVNTYVASSFIVWTNGNVQNTNNSYTAISDIKLKENIVDANSQWDDIKALQVRNYNLKEGQTHRQIGLIAQEVEPVSPGLVYESPDCDEEGNDLGTVTKSVNYSVLYMKAVKALQEAMERIETLEGMVAVNNITIDEQQHQLSTLAARLTALESA
jgi:hypothetical protein